MLNEQAERNCANNANTQMGFFTFLTSWKALEFNRHSPRDSSPRDLSAECTANGGARVDLPRGSLLVTSDCRSWDCRYHKLYNFFGFSREVASVVFQPEILLCDDPWTEDTCDSRACRKIVAGFALLPESTQPRMRLSYQVPARWSMASSRLAPTPRNTSSSRQTCGAIFSRYHCIDRAIRKLSQVPAYRPTESC